MERVATFDHRNQLTRYLMTAESKVAAAQAQASTGQVSSDYKGIGENTSQLVNLQAVYRRSEQYVDEGEVVNGRIQSMHSSVGSMVDLTNSLRSLITQLQGTATDDPDSIKASAQSLLDEFGSLLNTQQEGRYLFAGGKTDQAPVSLDDLAAQSSPSTADTSYYSGDDSVAYFQAADDQIIQYGVTANDPSIEKALRALNMIANLGTDPTDTDSVNEASDLAAEAADGLTVVQTKLGSSSATLERTIDRHVDEQLAMQTQVDNLSSVDLAEASTRLSQLQAALESTMSLMKILEDNNLSSILG